MSCSTPAGFKFKKNILSGAAASEACATMESASWIWHPEVDRGLPAVVRFSVDFEATDQPLVFHVSADQRFLLMVDGVALVRGPDAGDVAHWPFATYSLQLAPGRHGLEAQVWWIGAHAPMARMSAEGGFILKAEGPYDALLTTGSAAWQVRLCREYRFVPWLIEPYQAVGDQVCVDGRLREREDFIPAEAIETAGHDPLHGLSEDKWVLAPTPLPDQLSITMRCGRVRAVEDRMITSAAPIPESALAHAAMPSIQALLDGTATLMIPGHTMLSFVWDLEAYYCAFPKLGISGGMNARVSWSWAEALFEADLATKGHRDEVAGRFFAGMEDSFVSNGNDDQAYETLWWRAGRYCLISIQTDAEPLTLQRLEIEETRYPLENESHFSCDEPRVEELLQIGFRGLQCNAADKMTDGPYYEQLMYGGDTRVQALVHYVTSSDERLARRCIELFNGSRGSGCEGLTAARYPDRCTQWIPGFSLYWIQMVHDYYYWRTDTAFVAKQLLGARSVLNAFAAYLNGDDLLENIPHWVFFDWVDEWHEGYPPGGREGISSLMNLLYIQTLEKAAELEAALGSEPQAAIYRSQVERTARAVLKSCWSVERNMMADEPARECFSEHAQILVILSEVFDEETQRAALAALATPGLSKASIYFGHYLFEALFAMNEPSGVRARLEDWTHLSGQGFKTPPEVFGPTRSDCHAWGSHPIYHFQTGVQGILPASPGFKTVVIKPHDLGWKNTEGVLVHPWGEIKTTFNFEGDTLRGEVVLPAPLTGRLEWNGASVALAPGKNRVVL